MGVWADDESTVTTVSQEISRPNGANTGPSDFGSSSPALVSARRLMGANGGGLGSDSTGGAMRTRWLEAKFGIIFAAAELESGEAINLPGTASVDGSGGG